MVEALAPIEDVKLVPSESDPLEHSVQITSGLTSGCVEFNGYEVSIEENTIAITVTNLIPAEPVDCTSEYRRHEGEVTFDLGPGQPYKLVVNGKVFIRVFFARTRGAKMVPKASRVVSVEVLVSDGEVSLVVISDRNTGSSCTAHGGYHVSRRSEDRIDVTVFHLQLPGSGFVCSEDVVMDTTGIPLGNDFVPGRTYTVVVNGIIRDHEATFTVR